MTQALDTLSLSRPSRPAPAPVPDPEVARLRRDLEETKENDQAVIRVLKALAGARDVETALTLRLHPGAAAPIAKTKRRGEPSRFGALIVPPTSPPVRTPVRI